MKNPQSVPAHSWFYLHPYVHVSQKKEHVLLCNTLNGDMIEYRNNPLIAELVRRLDNARNAYVIRIEKENMNPKIREFITTARVHYIGDMVDSSLVIQKPMQLRPILRLERQIEELSIDVKANRLLEKDTIKGLVNWVSIHINSTCDQDCLNCQKMFRQFPCCHKSQKSKIWSLEEIQRLMDELQGYHIIKLNVLGGNILLHPQWRELVQFFNQLKIDKEYFVDVQQLVNNIDRLTCLSDESKLTITLSFPINQKVIENWLLFNKKSAITCSYRFILEKEADFVAAQELAKTYGLTNICYAPFFNVENLEFFQKHVYISRESLMDSAFPMSAIFANRTINRFFFKRLIIASDKKVYSNRNAPALGKLFQMKIDQMVVKEVNSNRAWMKVRKNLTPCKNCVYNSLCPPISNYESAIGQNNLCRMVDSDSHPL